MTTKVKNPALSLSGIASHLPGFTGLLLAMLSPTLLVLLAGTVKLGFMGAELFFWGVTVAIISIVLFWERKSLSSIGFRHLTLKDVALAIGIGLVLLLTFPAVYWVLYLMEVPMATETVKAIGSLPIPVLILLALRAGVTEEIIYRGFPIERLLPFTNSKALSVMLPLLVFILSHLSWGMAHLAFVSVAGCLLSLVYLWKRNLWINIISHFVVDIVLFLAVPYYL